MNRRGFIGAMLGAAVLDPEKLLFVPGRKVYSIPRTLTARELADCKRVMEGLVAHYYSEAFDRALKDAMFVGTGLMEVTLNFKPGHRVLFNPARQYKPINRLFPQYEQVFIQS